MNLKHALAALSMVLSFQIIAQEITLDDIYKKGTFRQKSVYGLESMNDGEHYTTLDEDNGSAAIIKYSYASGEKVGVIFTEKQLQDWASNSEIHMEAYQFSADENMLLITTDQEHIYRHSTKENYYIVDLQKKTATLLDPQGKQRHATFSPDGLKVAYVIDENIRIRFLDNRGVAQITKDGFEHEILNGYADWVYEEEFSFDRAFQWSPDGNKIAYYKFIESQVPEFNMQEFTALYPKDYRYKYPKAGERNSLVTLHVYDLPTFQTMDLNLGSYEYIPRIKWTMNSQLLSVMKMPRLQNELEIVLVEMSSGGTKTIYKETSSSYIEISDDLYFTKDNSSFIWKTEKDGYFHFYAANLNGQNLRPITHGDFEVRDILGFDETKNVLFFSASMKTPMNTEIYSVSIDGGEPKLLSPAEGISRADFSKGAKFYMLYHSTANTPLTISVHSADGNEIRKVEENKEYIEKTKALKLSKVEFFDLTTSQNVNLNGWMIKPANFDKKKKYPVLMFVYGGPGAQTVTNGSMGANYAWYQMLAKKGYIIVSVDNRGTGARGKEFRTQTYRQLGNLESQDQIEAAKWLAKQGYVDASRIGIWGWSYGGYMSSLCLFKGADIFKAAVAVAPVTNWRFYDSIYTERYMGLPQDNAKGYDDNSPINHVGEMKGNLLLIHGTGDDNVHYQNSVEMVDALIEADKQFEFMMYPGRNHGIYGGNTRYHLFTMITNFIEENL